MFDPGISIGQTLKNQDIVDIFRCGNMGGMRRSNATNTLVLISDYTKGIYHDKWIGGVLHYTGMGKSGDQDLQWSQNATLAASGRNGVSVHLFEVMDAGEYAYCGRVELVDRPYADVQYGEDGRQRKVWIFPIKPIPDNDVKKPSKYVFEDMDDYKKRGINIDSDYVKAEAKPANIAAGVKINHKSYGKGTITKVAGKVITVKFLSVGEKMLNYEICMQNNIIEFV
ncbi:MAG: HNH endonuclease [Oscillospiraceae bacterium]|nr:HNH endonuclease [Oscillospiraceae bacterium]